MSAARADIRSSLPLRRCEKTTTPLPGNGKEPVETIMPVASAGLACHFGFFSVHASAILGSFRSPGEVPRLRDIDSRSGL